MTMEPNFGYLVHDVARLHARRFNERAVLRIGLTRAQCRLLGFLARNEGINQAGLADLLDIKPMTLVRQVDRMEEAGWIARRPDPADRRARRLYLTERARPILDRIRAVAAEVKEEALAGMSADEEEALVDQLRRVHANLADAVAAPPLAAAAGFADTVATPRAARAAEEV
jgi:MarR family transcriptional regulator, transcriptional regulator for hemolysin